VMGLASGSGLVKLDLSISLLLCLRCGEGGDGVPGGMRRHPAFGLADRRCLVARVGVTKRKRW
ncbi:MAG: hypothetical protein O3A51_10955, partial [Verrucomicrobia bacterium]|nr:hypothetical protein [Verrucomicrobiota bacterium]